MASRTIETNRPDETIAQGRLLAEELKPGDVVAFFGDLGSGKTTMIKGIAQGLGVTEVVRSPSFVIATEYDGRVSGKPVKIRHIDLYRLHSSSELVGLGFAELIDDQSIVLIEWADRAESELPQKAIRITLKADDESHREIVIERQERI